MSQVLDALIIGAGPAGSFAAYKLSQIGVSVVLLEKSSQLKRKVCGEYLCPAGAELLKSEGFDMSSTTLPLNGMLMVSSKGTEINADFPRLERSKGLAINREIFDSYLLEKAKEAGARVLLGAEVKNISRSGEHWIVETATDRYITRLLVGADGRKSLVSKFLKNDVELPVKRVALHAYALSEELNRRRGEMHLFENGSYVGVNPTGEHEVNFSLVLDADELQALGGPRSALNHYIHKSKNLSSRFTPFAEDDVITAAYPIQHRTRSIIPAPHVALLGDAAGFVDPLTGEGMYNALLSAKIFSEEIKKARSQSLIIQQKAFEHYEKRYSQVLKSKIRLNRFFQFLIKKPKWVELVARFLKTHPSRANAFMGIIGNVYSPIEGLLKLF